MSGTGEGLPRDHDGTDEVHDSERTLHGSTTYGADSDSDFDATRSDPGSAETVLHEERAVTGTETVDAGSVRVRKHVETHPVEYSVPRDVEHVDTSERISVAEGDSGEVEVLEDGSVSIPVFEEVLVVTKRLVVRERVIVRKHTVVDEYQLQTELRREHISVDADDSVDLVDNRSGAGVDRDDTTTDDTTDRT
ncbi:YsnF/AvaK domain-containing protein [Nocardioides renjunii]|uniref:YsnF/AvaK domain-containing protein n=1 Tax=Nocardioides renjunii TaxID=3095075 RepID=UPI002AFF3861|nr:YsnF/AvaK domain-containing protein [Nocardioides sp. S-34]WQQ22930.1 YsnF/AvaK domain-containing protein [Nocardioides sp. S-34]